MARDSFIFYRSFYEAIEDIDCDNKLLLYDAICRKSLYGEEVELTGIAGTLYKLIKPQLDANNERYRNGSKGGRPKTKGMNNTETIGFQNEKPNKNKNENKNVNENENKNENNNGNVDDSCVDGLQQIIDFYNNNIGLITPYGLEILSDYAKEMQTDLIIYAMQISVEANKRTIQYIKAILNNWQKAGIKTLTDARQENKRGRSAEEEFLNE